MAMSVDVQFSEALAEKIRHLAAIDHRSPGEMVRLLAEEAIEMREFPQVVFTNDPTGRRATLIHGPDVWEIIEPYLVAGKDWQVLRDSYPERDEALLRTAVRYYEAYPAEIEARIALNQSPE